MYVLAFLRAASVIDRIIIGRLALFYTIIGSTVISMQGNVARNECGVDTVS